MQNSIPPSTAILSEVRAEMGRSKITRRTLADHTGTDPATVGNWLAGKTSIRLDSLLTVCDVLEVPLEELAHRARVNSERVA